MRSFAPRCNSPLPAHGVRTLLLGEEPGSRLETFPVHSLKGKLGTRSTRTAMEVAALSALPEEHPAIRTQTPHSARHSVLFITLITHAIPP